MSKLTISEPSKLFFTADTHFEHKNVINYCNRPYKDIKEMREQIINIWNETVGTDDTLIHLGDFSFASLAISKRILEVLNGNIILVKGNHDSTQIVKNCGFSDVVDFLELKVKENTGVVQLVSCMHYPMAVWPSAHYGTWHLHGHSHGTYKTSGRILDVGWDVHKKPISYYEVKQYMMDKPPMTNVDHRNENRL